ncbi:MAG TPA: SRPBCC family protein, partial [Aestuariivirga sp.]
MARAYASAIIKAPVETVWSLIRDFNGLPSWAASIVDSKIEGGLDSDVVGCVRSFHTDDGTETLRSQLNPTTTIWPASSSCWRRWEALRKSSLPMPLMPLPSATS